MVLNFVNGESVAGSVEVDTSIDFHELNAILFNGRIYLFESLKDDVVTFQLGENVVFRLETSPLFDEV